MYHIKKNNESNVNILAIGADVATAFAPLHVQVHHQADHDGADDVEAEAQATADGKAECELEDGQEPPVKKVKKASKSTLKNSQWKAYSDEEKKVFKTLAVASNGESRPLSALDDLLQALNFVLAKLIKDKVIKESEVDSERVLSTMGFCASLFFEFAWVGKVSVNGKEFRPYSSLRSEIQQTFMSTNEQLWGADMAASEGDGGTENEASSNKKGTNRMLNTLELAELLCQSFLDKPVHSVIWDIDDPDEIVIRNIADCMATKKMGDPVRKFVDTKLHLPLQLHEAVQSSLSQIFAMSKSSAETPDDVTTETSLLDLLAIAFGCINEQLPASWIGFAFDVVTAYAERSHFVEDTAKAAHLFSPFDV